MANYGTDAFSGSATFTPAAAGHTTPAVVGVATEFVLKDKNGGVPAVGSHLRITSATLQINGGTIETTAWRLHLYTVTPPSAYTDTTTFDIVTNDLTIYLGYVDLSQVLDLGTTLYIDMPALNKQIKLTGTSVFGYLVNGTTLTPQAVAHIVTLQTQAI